MNDVSPELIVTDEVDAHAAQIIGAGLDGFNDAIVGYGDRRPLAVVAKDPSSGEVLGGAIGRSSLGLLFLELFFLPPQHRCSGLGSRILAMFEDAGRQRGCRSAVLYTISFQAPKFYERHGWRAFGEVPCDPPGTSHIFMSKTLAPRASGAQA